MTSNPALRMTDSFPKSPAPCREVSQKFFSCFNQNCKKEKDNDANAGIRGLEACLQEKVLYDTCMEKYILKNPPKLFRVSILNPMLP